MGIEIIAEIGQNHDGDLKLARELIYCAAEAGADVVKFQAFDAKKLFNPTNNPWYNYNIQAELSRDAFAELKELSDTLEIEFMVSVFDEDRIPWFESLAVKRYKVASRSVFDTNLLTCLDSCGKPLIVSTGLLPTGELPHFAFTSPVKYLYCISKYPTQLSEIRFSNIDFMTLYDGFSDHTVGVTASVIAMARGASIIEKHITLDQRRFGPDHSCSLLPSELEDLVRWRDRITECKQ